GVDGCERALKIRVGRRCGNGGSHGRTGSRREGDDRQGQPRRREREKQQIAFPHVRVSGSIRCTPLRPVWLHESPQTAEIAILSTASRGTMEGGCRLGPVLNSMSIAPPPNPFVVGPPPR